ncbi:hypothetical protein [Lentibacillus amyloliquefaciens]|uniref:hypothetical protein n=1 Tax=Lentibacillus amyloliquefaciens TaxID=1472767 RepID=UPI0012E3B4E7|nr:hypothetical protein [Lentibacillus amyloliquefaciens]
MKWDYEKSFGIIFSMTERNRDGDIIYKVIIFIEEKMKAYIGKLILTRGCSKIRP